MVFTNDVKAEVISKADFESNMLNDITTTKDVSISNKIEEIGKPVEATLINGQDSPKGVDFENYRPLYEVKEADNGGYDGTTYINPDYVSTSRSSAITVEIYSRGYGSEMAWNLTASDGTEVASGGPYSNCSDDSITLDLADGEYTFNAIDNYGDGWNSTWSCDGYGSYAVYDADGVLLAGYEGDQFSQVVTGSGTSETFTVQEPVPATAEVVVTVYSGGYGSEMAWSLSDSSGLYEPVHGSAPDIAGMSIVNPMAMILSCAMMFEYSLNRVDLAEIITSSVRNVLKSGIATKDLTDDNNYASTSQMGDKILEDIKKSV